MGVSADITKQYKRKLKPMYGSYKEIEKRIREKHPDSTIHYNTVCAMQNDIVVEVAKEYLDEQDEKNKKFQLNSK